MNVPVLVRVDDLGATRRDRGIRVRHDVFHVRQGRADVITTLEAQRNRGRRAPLFNCHGACDRGPVAFAPCVSVHDFLTRLQVYSLEQPDRVAGRRRRSVDSRFDA